MWNKIYSTIGLEIYRLSSKDEIVYLDIKFSKNQRKYELTIVQGDKDYYVEYSTKNDNIWLESNQEETIGLVEQMLSETSPPKKLELD